MIESEDMNQNGCAKKNLYENPLKTLKEFDEYGTQPSCGAYCENLSKLQTCNDAQPVLSRL